MKSKLTQERLKEVLYYDPDTGKWFWRVSIGGSKIHSIAGRITPDGYRYIQIDKHSYRSGRLAFLYMLGYFPEHEAEHINRDRCDDRWLNIREATRQCNNRNRGIMKSNSSGVTGVRLDNGYWRSSIGVNGKIIHLSCSKIKTEVVKARWEAEKEYNFPKCNTTSTAYLYLKDRGLI